MDDFVSTFATKCSELGKAQAEVAVALEVLPALASRLHKLSLDRSGVFQSEISLRLRKTAAVLISQVQHLNWVRDAVEDQFSKLADGKIQ